MALLLQAHLLHQKQGFLASLHPALRSGFRLFHFPVPSKGAYNKLHPVWYIPVFSVFPELLPQNPPAFYSLFPLPF